MSRAGAAGVLGVALVDAAVVGAALVGSAVDGPGVLDAGVGAASGVDGEDEDAGVSEGATTLIDEPATADGAGPRSTVLPADEPATPEGVLPGELSAEMAEQPAAANAIAITPTNVLDARRMDRPAEMCCACMVIPRCRVRRRAEGDARSPPLKQ